MPNNPRLPGTSFVSRLLAKRFQIVDPKVQGQIDGDVQPVFVVGAQDDATGLNCRAIITSLSSIAVVARHSFVGVESYGVNPNELVIYAITVYAPAAGVQDYFLYSVAAGAMAGGSVQNIAYAEGGQRGVIPGANALAQINDSAGLPTQQLLDRFRVPTGVGEVTHAYPGGIIVRGAQALELVTVNQNQPIDAVFRGTERPLTN